MPVELKFFPQFQHLSSDGQSMIVLDVKIGNIFEVDRLTAAVLEEGQRFGTFSDEAFDSARAVLASRGIGSGEVEPYVNQVKELIENGYFPESYSPTKPKHRYRSIILDVSQTCQLNCVYCFASGGSFGNDALSPLMSLDIGQKAIDYLFSIADSDATQYRITYFGGEPLLNWPLIEELTEYALNRASSIGKTMSFSLTTNGIGLNEQMAQHMKSHGMKILISVDGDRELHNRLRPCKDNTIDSYESTVKAVALLRELYGSVSGRATITRECSDPVAVYEMLKQAGITDPMCVMVGGSDHDLSLRPDDLQTYIKGTKQLLRTETAYFYRNMLLARTEQPPAVPRPCGFALDSMTVDSSGKIYACHRAVANEKFYLGNIFTGLDDLLVDKLSDSVATNNVLGCRTCWARMICLGICPAENDVATGHPYYPAPQWCSMQKAMVETAIEIYLGDLQKKAADLDAPPVC